MSPRLLRIQLSDGSFIDRSIERIQSDRWRPHGVRYRFAWIQNGKCRVLFDNHHGKGDHCHIDGVESSYQFTSAENLLEDFLQEIRNLGGPVDESSKI